MHSDDVQRLSKTTRALSGQLQALVGSAELVVRDKPATASAIGTSKRFIMVLIAILSQSGVIVTAQVQAPIPSEQHPNVLVTRLKDERASYPNILDRDEARSISTNAFVLSNRDSRDIIGIAAIWAITEQDGHIYTSTYTSDICFANAPNSVILSGHSALLTPIGWLNPEVYRSRLANGIDMGSTGRAPLVSKRIAQAKSITFSVDSIIFSDGEICGANVSYLDKQIYSRYRAARSIASLVRSAVADSKDWRPVLETYKGLPDGIAPYSDNYWKMQFAAQLLAPNADTGNLLNFYESLPIPLTVHACKS